MMNASSSPAGPRHHHVRATAWRIAALRCPHLVAYLKAHSKVSILISSDKAAQHGLAPITIHADSWRVPMTVR
jgi:hypothetical protein